MSHPAPNPVPKRPPIGLYGGNILVAAPRRWDEACFSVPALRAIRSSRPRCTLGVICHEEQLGFWQSVSGIDDILIYDDRTSIRSIVRAQESSRCTWESAILWEINKGSECCNALKIKQRLGYSTKELQKLLTDAVVAPVAAGPIEHRVQSYLQLMSALNVPTQKPELFLPVDMQIPQCPGTVLVCPESDYGGDFIVFPLKGTTDRLQNNWHYLGSDGSDSLDLESIHTYGRFSFGRFIPLPERIELRDLLGTGETTDEKI
jgi:hypothetical protein